MCQYNKTSKLGKEEMQKGKGSRMMMFDPLGMCSDFMASFRSASTPGSISKIKIQFLASISR
jgi:hypothetical protein